MQQELDNNSHKGNWETFTDENQILEEFDYHYDKLQNIRLTNRDPQLLKEHIADCANILMFLGNSFKLYDK